jgi:hypothetical protein
MHFRFCSHFVFILFCLCLFCFILLSVLISFCCFFFCCCCFFVCCFVLLVFANILLCQFDGINPSTNIFNSPINHLFIAGNEGGRGRSNWWIGNDILLKLNHISRQHLGLVKHNKFSVLMLFSKLAGIVNGCIWMIGRKDRNEMSIVVLEICLCNEVFLILMDHWKG